MHIFSDNGRRATSDRRPIRFLLLSASMGAGHDTVAAALGARLAAAGHIVAQADILDLLPVGTGPALRSGYHAIIAHAPVVYAGIYNAFFRDGAVPRPGSTPLAALAAGRLRRLIARAGPDVVVSVFHLAAQAAGYLRARDELEMPCAVVVTDFAVHRQWVHPATDLHLCVAPAVTEWVRHSGRPAVTAGPVLDARFTSRQKPPGEAGWRAKLAPHGGRAVLLSAGAWGAATQPGQTARAVQAAGYLPVILCGRNERLRAELANLPGGIALGWVDDMPGLMAASRALIDNAAGQTCLEALAMGLPVVAYRPLPGHGREGVARMAELGLSEQASDADGLLRALDRAAAPGAARQHRVAAGRALASLSRGSEGHLASLARLADSAGAPR
jgi:UDP-N-acetylglucosamine:LPS N-acetylglucosamine transferase